MPTTICEILNAHNIEIANCVPWGTSIHDNNEGVYLVSTSGEPRKNLGITEEPLFDDFQIELWINKLDNFLVDNAPATVKSLKDRLKRFWLPDENILYIGKAPKRQNSGGIGKRIKEYHSTEIGDGGPHSGGQWIKILANITKLYVYYGYSDKPGTAEKMMLRYFMRNVSYLTLARLYDKELPLPFANINLSGNKKHGLKNQRL
jgi:hypothetical protein